MDSGVDADHPVIDGRVAGYMAISVSDGGDLVFDDSPHEDNSGHGTACAGIILGLAPECELYSVRVMGRRGGKGLALVAGIRWVIEQELQVANLSLGTTKRDFFGTLHELTDEAYFQHLVLVTAANNFPIPSFPCVPAAWKGGGVSKVTGNSVAAPHITGIVARILEKHPSLTVFQTKGILRALAANVRRRPAGAPNAPGA